MSWRAISEAAVIALAAALVLATPFPAPPAAAVGPPRIDDRAVPVDTRPRPPEETEQRSECARPVATAAPTAEPPVPQVLLNTAAAWRFSRGAGQRVAVVDTGVNRHPRLTVEAGGDFVHTSDGTHDCDGHGTLVAGVIAGHPSLADGFAGVAPDASILAIRQVSLAYAPKNRHDRTPGAIADTGYGDVRTLAAAVVHAVQMGATVVNISEVACAAVGEPLGDEALGAAVRFAYERNVVVVAAAGNVTPDGPCRTQNAGDWAGVSTLASPAWFAPYVLTVAATDEHGAPADFSLHGPWVGVAAPGVGVVSLDSAPGSAGLVDAVPSAAGLGPLTGTSFAAGYVSGVVALVRSRYPSWTAGEVIDRIQRTAHAPGSGRDDRVGYGVVDPVAALTAQLPPADAVAAAVVSRPIAAPRSPAPADPRPRRIAVAGTVAALVVLGLGAALSIPYRRVRGRAPEDDVIDEFRRS
ncbi:type VII secretion-associated serine protease mycosin [Nocardia sp. NBC_00416]|uniref:type VII secretion-associated serine protease mycosin n=1 Tax=Nocardia sp. NBC_00416 TaxID=2975991 RepID=UPI002E2370A7